MNDIWIVNASPVITLAKIHHLNLLELSGVQPILPDAVAMEIASGPTGDLARLAVEGGWGLRRSPKVASDKVIEWGLGAGETAVLSLAMDLPGATTIIDDGTARAAARSLGIMVMGTLGVVVRAKAQGKISSAGKLLRELKDNGLYMDETIIRLALSQMGESWPP